MVTNCVQTGMCVVVLLLDSMYLKYQTFPELIYNLDFFIVLVMYFVECCH